MNRTDEIEREAELEDGSFHLSPTAARIWLCRGETLGRWLRTPWPGTRTERPHQSLSRTTSFMPKAR